MKVNAPKMDVMTNQNVKVTWSWYNQSEGAVQWTFQNLGQQEESVILLRGAVDAQGNVVVNYYFGNAYWVVYLSEGVSTWQEKNKPLQDNGVENNAPPLSVIKIGEQYLVAFTFTLLGGQTWSMLEGGFVNGIQPYNPVAVPVTYQGDKNFCVGYDPAQVTRYVEQTGLPVTGYEPNPSNFTVSLYTGDGPFINLFKDYVEEGSCKKLQCVNKMKKVLTTRK